MSDVPDEVYAAARIAYNGVPGTSLGPGVALAIKHDLRLIAAIREVWHLATGQADKEAARCDIPDEVYEAARDAYADLGRMIGELCAERDRYRDHYPTDHRLDYCVCGESWTENHDGRTSEPAP